MQHQFTYVYLQTDVLHLQINLIFTFLNHQYFKFTFADLRNVALIFVFSKNHPSMAIHDFHEWLKRAHPFTKTDLRQP